MLEFLYSFVVKSKISAKSSPVRNELIFSVVKAFDANISHVGNFVLTAKTRMAGKLIVTELKLQ